MLKISRYSAYQYMDQADFDLMDSTHERLATVAKNKGKSGELSSQFYVTVERNLRLDFYIGGEKIGCEKVEEILFVFDKKIALTENGEKKLAEILAEKNMTEISQEEAMQSIDENDLAVLKDELHLLESSNQNKEQFERYFTDGTMIYLKVYWDGEQVHTVSFTNRAELTERVEIMTGKKKGE